MSAKPKPKQRLSYEQIRAQQRAESLEKEKGASHGSGAAEVRTAAAPAAESLAKAASQQLNLNQLRQKQAERQRQSDTVENSRVPSSNVEAASGVRNAATLLESTRTRKSFNDDVDEEEEEPKARKNSGGSSGKTQETLNSTDSGKTPSLAVLTQKQAEKQKVGPNETPRGPVPRTQPAAPTNNPRGGGSAAPSPNLRDDNYLFGPSYWRQDEVRKLLLLRACVEAAITNSVRIQEAVRKIGRKFAKEDINNVVKSGGYMLALGEILSKFYIMDTVEVKQNDIAVVAAYVNVRRTFEENDTPTVEAAYLNAAIEATNDTTSPYLRQYALLMVGVARYAVQYRREVLRCVGYLAEKDPVTNFDHKSEELGKLSVMVSTSGLKLDMFIAIADSYSRTAPIPVAKEEEDASGGGNTNLTARLEKAKELQTESTDDEAAEVQTESTDDEAAEVQSDEENQQSDQLKPGSNKQEPGSSTQNGPRHFPGASSRSGPDGLSASDYDSFADYETDE